MSTKSKAKIKVKDLKPKKDARGGAGRFVAQGGASAFGGGAAASGGGASASGGGASADSGNSAN